MEDLTLRHQGVLELALPALREGLGERLVAVVLFGSRARSEAKPESDWDLLVLAEGLPENLFDRSLFLKRLLPPGARGAISCLARTSEEFQAALPPLYLDIALDGKILYDPRGYAADHLARLRSLIQEAGLYREQTPAGDIWRWQQPPVGLWSVEWK